MTVRILVVTLGTLGDLHPMIAIAQRLCEQGAEVILAGPEHFRATVQTTSLKFASIGSASTASSGPSMGNGLLPEMEANAAFMDHTNFQDLRRLYDDLYSISDNFDAVVALIHVVPAHLIAERRRIPLIACTFSSRLPRVGASRSAQRFGVMRWQHELSNLRAARGLSRKILPLSSALTSPTVVLGIFPEFLYDTAAGTEFDRLLIVGYPIFDQHHLAADPEVSAFCDRDTVAFSFGSYADAADPHFFLEESVSACASLGVKCLYLSRFVEQRSDRSCLVREYASHDDVLPKTGCVVHHGGMGTLMAACRHRKPMVIVPFLLDQPYNATRMQSYAGVDVVPARDFTRANIATVLAKVFDDLDARERKIAALLNTIRDGGPLAATIILSVAREGRLREDWHTEHAYPDTVRSHANN